MEKQRFSITRWEAERAERLGTPDKEEVPLPETDMNVSPLEDTEISDKPEQEDG